MCQVSGENELIFEDRLRTGFCYSTEDGEGCLERGRGVGVGEAIYSLLLTSESSTVIILLWGVLGHQRAEMTI